MRCHSALQTLVLAATSLSALSPVSAATAVPNWLPQSWFFDWTPAGAPLPVPITAQCETIHITWTRGSATGPDPFSPYFLQIYSSNYVFPFIIPAGPDPKADVTIPFAPGSQYEICMFDTNGNTGGCQAIYTVYANSSATPTCANFTMPTNTLNATSEYSKGPLSMYGWVDSCSDIRVTPRGGTPPYTFTVAPALHPPLNITSNDMSPINWTVSLSWASPFFISLVDSTGLSWSNGPIHSGDGNTNCLALAGDSSSSSSNQVMVGTTVGAALGGLVLGSLASLLAAYMISRRRTTSKLRRQQAGEPIPFISTDDPHYDSLPSQSPPAERQQAMFHQQSAVGSKQRGIARPASTTLPHEYNVEPYQYDGPSPLTSSHSVTASDSMSPLPHSWNDAQETHMRTASASGSISSPDRQEGGSQVYVIHHDSGRAPVSVITSRGTEVVELPPGYSPDYLSADAADAGNANNAPARRSGKTPPGSR